MEKLFFVAAYALLTFGLLVSSIVSLFMGIYLGSAVQFLFFLGMIAIYAAMKKEGEV